MLEVKNLKRIYKVKNNAPVYALNDVSLKFPEKGLVFILGKSGSGKSTLLNVMGGLDKADEGEIIINGKSSKEFTDSEMDSYRNTYLGFIFQEYNILSDYTIKENIALALQLQHKPVTDKAIDDILAQVDLVGYSKRKPNELSGGQKQRVAIARALVKEPKIIFADEPTGALDSTTGKQVFETLKNLSKEKLVVVVSHDRDFAEHFGDRVIELKDGKILSDISKTTCKVESPIEGVSLIGDNIIKIDKQHKLTPEDLEIINSKLSSSNEDIYITSDSRVNQSICESGRIDKDGNQEKFIDTDPNSIKTNDSKFSLIKSHFPFKHAFKMGAKSLRVKPFRLVMTIILSTIAFTLFGVSSTLSLFNTKLALNSTIEQNNIKAFSISGYEKTTSGYASGLSSETLSDIESKTGVKIYQLDLETATQLNCVNSPNDNFHLNMYQGSIGIDQTSADDLGLSLYSGKLPSNEYEVCISKYAYYTYKDFGLVDPILGEIEPDYINQNSILGLTINVPISYDGGITNINAKICGIVDTLFPTKYEKYRTDSSTLNYSNNDYLFLQSFKYSSNLHNIIYTYKSNDALKDESIIMSGTFTPLYNNGGSGYIDIGYYSNLTDSVYFDARKSNINNDEAIISYGAITSFISKDDMDIYIPNTSSPSNLIDLKATIDETYAQVATEYYGYDLSEEELYKLVAAELENIDLSNMDVTINGAIHCGYDKETGLDIYDSKEYKLVGLDFSSDYYYSRYVCVNKESATNIQNLLKEHGIIYFNDTNNAFVAYKNQTNLDKFLDLYTEKYNLFKNTKSENISSGEYKISFNDTLLSTVDSYANIFSTLTKAFVYIGIFFAIFSALLFYNFMSVSINNKKIEIGILRAVGAKRGDVFKIFYSEAFIIAIINFILSTALTFIISSRMNASMLGKLNLGFSLMNPNGLIILMLLAIALGVSFIASIIPVSIIANKKPIDAIHNK